MSGTTLLLYTLIALISYFLYKQINRLKYWQKLGIPCEEPALIFGNLIRHQHEHNFDHLFYRHYKQFKGTGPFAGFYWFHNPAAFVLDFDLVKNILIKDSAKFSGRGDDDPLGRLSLLNGHKFRYLTILLFSYSSWSVLKVVTNSFRRIVHEIMEFCKRNYALRVRRNDFIDSLMELNKKTKSVLIKTYTNLALKELMFYNAGFETSLSTIKSVLYMLARHQDIQQKAREEVQQIYEKHEELGHGCMKDMPYLDQIISETLRFHTVVPFLIRYAKEDYIVPGHPSYVIKKGMRVLIPFAIHIDADFYPNPYVFNPDNFLPEQAQTRVHKHFILFGEDPSNSFGLRFGLMQTRMGLSLLLKHFKFSVCPKTEIPLQINKESIILRYRNFFYNSDLKMEKL